MSRFALRVAAAAPGARPRSRQGVCCQLGPPPPHTHSGRRDPWRLCRSPACPPNHQCLQGVVSQITPVSPSIFKLPEGRRYPPALFVHMAERDPGKAETVTEALKVLK